MGTHNHHENMTLLRLSQKLNCPSQVLVRKYASPYMSGVSITTQNFLQETACRQAIPPAIRRPRCFLEPRISHIAP
jgi:hypothetical protein